MNRKVETVKEIPLLGGKTKREVSYTYKNELVVTGASNPYSEDDARSYKTETIKAALAERQTELEQKQKEASEGKKSRANGFNTGNATNATHRAAPNMGF